MRTSKARKCCTSCGCFFGVAFCWWWKACLVLFCLLKGYFGEGSLESTLWVSLKLPLFADVGRKGIRFIKWCLETPLKSLLIKKWMGSIGRQVSCLLIWEKVVESFLVSILLWTTPSNSNTAPFCRILIHNNKGTPLTISVFWMIATQIDGSSNIFVKNNIFITVHWF